MLCYDRIKLINLLAQSVAVEGSVSVVPPTMKIRTSRRFGIIWS